MEETIKRSRLLVECLQLLNIRSSTAWILKSVESGTLLVFSLEFFQLLLFFIFFFSWKNNVACLTVASQQPLSQGAGGGWGVGETLIESLLAGQFTRTMLKYRFPCNKPPNIALRSWRRRESLLYSYLHDIFYGGNPTWQLVQRLTFFSCRLCSFPCTRLKQE